jgi:sporulation protein YlmC with PRC-barrel domain
MSVTSHALLWLAGIATVGAVLNPTQDPSQKQDPNKRPPPAQTPPTAATTAPAMNSNFASLDDLLGCEVVFNATGSTSPDAKKDDNNKKGKVKDLVVSTNDGRVVGLVVHGGEAGDKNVLIPATNAMCTVVDKKPCYMLRTTKTELDGYGEFDVKKAEKEGLDHANLERLRGMISGKETGDPSKKDTGEPGVAPDKTDKAPAPMAFVLGSTIKGCEINASDKHFGKIRDAAIDTKSNMVAYLLVSHGGVGSVGDTMFMVPFTAARWAREDEKTVLKLQKTTDELKAAPEYKKPDQGFISADQMRSSDSFWGGRKPGTPPPTPN